VAYGILTKLRSPLFVAVEDDGGGVKNEMLQRLFLVIWQHDNVDHSHARNSNFMIV